MTTLQAIDSAIASRVFDFAVKAIAMREIMQKSFCATLSCNIQSILQKLMRWAKQWSEPCARDRSTKNLQQVRRPSDLLHRLEIVIYSLFDSPVITGVFDQRICYSKSSYGSSLIHQRNQSWPPAAEHSGPCWEGFFLY